MTYELEIRLPYWPQMLRFRTRCKLQAYASRSCGEPESALSNLAIGEGGHWSCVAKAILSSQLERLTPKLLPATALAFFHFSKHVLHTRRAKSEVTAGRGRGPVEFTTVTPVLSTTPCVHLRLRRPSTVAMLL